MTNGDLTPGDNIVDEAADVERRLAHIRELITLAEAKEAAARDIEEHKGNQTKKEEKDGVGDVLKEVFLFLFSFEVNACVSAHSF